MLCPLPMTLFAKFVSELRRKSWELQNICSFRHFMDIIVGIHGKRKTARLLMLSDAMPLSFSESDWG